MRSDTRVLLLPSPFSLLPSPFSVLRSISVRPGRVHCGQEALTHAVVVDWQHLNHVHDDHALTRIHYVVAAICATPPVRPSRPIAPGAEPVDGFEAEPESQPIRAVERSSLVDRHHVDTARREDA